MKSARQDAQYWENSKDKKIDKSIIPVIKKFLRTLGITAYGECNNLHQNHLQYSFAFLPWVIAGVLRLVYHCRGQRYGRRGSREENRYRQRVRLKDGHDRGYRVCSGMHD